MASCSNGHQLTDLMRLCSTIILSENTLSSAFEPHMGVFIDAQNKLVYNISQQDLYTQSVRGAER